MTDQQAKVRSVTHLRRAYAQRKALIKHSIALYPTPEQFKAVPNEVLQHIYRDFEAGFMAGIEWALEYLKHDIKPG